MTLKEFKDACDSFKRDLEAHRINVDDYCEYTKQLREEFLEAKGLK